MKFLCNLKLTFSQKTYEKIPLHQKNAAVNLYVSKKIWYTHNLHPTGNLVRKKRMALDMIYTI